MKRALKSYWVWVLPLVALVYVVYKYYPQIKNWIMSKYEAVKAQSPDAFNVSAPLRLTGSVSNPIGGSGSSRVVPKSNIKTNKNSLPVSTINPSGAAGVGAKALGSASIGSGSSSFRPPREVSELLIIGG